MGVPKAFSIENEESTSKYGVGLTVFLAHLRLVNSRRKIRALLVFLVSCFVFAVGTGKRKIRGEILRRTCVFPWSRTHSTLPAGKPRSPCLSCVLLCFPPLGRASGKYVAKYGVELAFPLGHVRLVRSLREIRALLVFLVSCFVFPVETSERKIRGEILRRTFVSPWSRTFSTLPAGKPRSPCLSCVLLCFPRWDEMVQNLRRNTASGLRFFSLIYVS